MEKAEKASVKRTVREIIENVRAGGDEVVLDYTEKFDGYRPSTLRMDPEVVTKAYSAYIRFLASYFCV